jgi:hypothetical protein
VVLPKGSRIRLKLIGAHHWPDREISGSALIDPVKPIIDVIKVDEFRARVRDIENP